MRNATTLVAVVKKSSNATTNGTRNNYWVNGYNSRGELSISSPYDSKEEALAHAERIAKVLNYTRAGEDRWECGKRVLEVAERGDIYAHIADTMMMTASAVEAENGVEVYDGTPRRSLLILLRCIFALKKSVAEGNAALEDIARRYYTDAGVKANFDARARRLASATTKWEMASAILNL